VRIHTGWSLTPTTRPEGVAVGDGLGVDDGLGVADGLGEDDGLELGDGEDDADGDGVGEDDEVGLVEADEVGVGDQVACGRCPLPILYALAADALSAGLPATTRPMADTVMMASTLAFIEGEGKWMFMRGTPGAARGSVLSPGPAGTHTQEFGRRAGAFNTPIGRSACVLVRFGL
jgi:hypothetical protein